MATERLRKLKLHDFGGVQTLLDHRGEVKASFGPTNVLETGSGAGMARDKEAAAILVRFNRYLERSNLLRFLRDLQFIHPD